MGANVISSNDLGKLLLRLSVGGLMLFHGVHKLQHGVDFISNMLAEAGLPQVLSYGVFVGEVIAPLMIVLGILSRPAALVEAFVMLMAVYLVHMGELWQLTEHGGYALELQALYFFGSLAIVFLGSGRYSVSGGNGALD
ncbi:DoxX family protein [Prosthecochloris sp. N3]|uniref:DoxX family protein n=1 Tax=Prosthecochloris ethylica TaxID=2743976 RepID=A0ABR9XSP3_9CHLB|nr:DoxX family protein [Prosthecochloris ethylica]MBF0586637.1 DoxX family protein [Prosthecochloris ethylica]MBF0637009.1 DoxX family protein [Prosthecochloris ethylica]NUK47880.1 DoxX family protein [Prosthecochloris ethylica]